MSKSRPVLVLNGPNLNRLGTREREIYGSTSLADIESLCVREGERLGLEIDFRQSNHEGDLVDLVQQAQDRCAGIVINAAAYSHTSIALLDALRMVTVPVVEVHLSNIFRRESYRCHSYVTLAATGVICGLGAQGYALALQAIAERAVGHTGET